MFKGSWLDKRLRCCSKISKRFSKDFESAYKFLLPGYNVRPNEINAAIGLEQIKKLDNMVKIRRKNLEVFKIFFK